MAFYEQSGSENRLEVIVNNFFAKEMAAGGPGSGRKPVNGDAHKFLIDKGYKHVGNRHGIEKMSVYQHPTKSAHAEVNSDGAIRYYKGNHTVGYVRRDIKSEGCSCLAAWGKFKKDPTYDHYMRAHRVKKGKIEATSPKGAKDMVAHMKANHKEISNPHALAWYMHESKKNIKAGGPGSGRKPSWQKDSPKHQELDRLHKLVTGDGYKYNYSTSSGKGKIDHVYKDAGGNNGGKAIITESKSGNHDHVFIPPHSITRWLERPAKLDRKS